jgi:hypothetical protein
MNINAFETAFGKTKEKNLKECKTDIFIKNRKCTHPVKIADESSENILGIDFLQKFRLHLDPKMKEITFQSAPSRALFATKNFTIPPFATTLVQARTFQNINSQLHYIADIAVPKQPLISGLSTLVSFDHRNLCTMPIQNCAPHEINISTGNILGILSTEKEEPIPFNDDSLATICEQIHQRLPKVKKRAWTRKEIEERCHLGAPEPYRSPYIDILVKHQAAISLDKYDLGLAKNFTHRIHLKDNQPIFRKQFNLPEAHTQFIEQSGRMAQTRSGPAIQLQLQFTYLLRTKEARARTPDCTGFSATQPALPHQQVLHERDQRMHRGHRASQFVHLYHSESHFRILANETGSRITTPDRFYHSEPRTISLDYLPHGPTRLPSKLSEINGTSFTRIEPHPHLHRRRADPHRHPRETPGSPGTSTHEIASAPLENQSGQMSVW